jgi:hypothetical protein
VTTVRSGIDLTGLDLAPSQTWGAVRLVPLLRAEPIVDLRLHPRLYGEELSVVLVEPRTAYVSYVPHAFVATWTGDGQPAAAYGTQLRDPRATRKAPSCVPLRFHRRMARRTGKHRLRFLPQHLALEGYLALHFGGPEVAWEEWSRRAIAQGLSPRCEAAYVGAEIPGLDDALRVFEIHPGQCGMLIFVADALAGAFVVPHPDDYRALHATLLQDLYGELLYLYAQISSPVSEPHPGVDAARVRSIADLRVELERARAQWAAAHAVMAGGLLEQADLAFERVYRMGRFTLWRFLPSFDPQGENHIGESITDPEGRLAYLKTFRLSAAQTRRGHLLASLAAHRWELDATAAALGTNLAGLILRLDRAGFGHLLRQDILDACRNRNRPQRR